jgi:hypothetical protein
MRQGGGRAAARKESANRTDGGFFVRGNLVMQASDKPGLDRGAWVLVTGLALERFPTLAHEIANLMNRMADLPGVTVPKRRLRAAERNAG